MDRVLATQRGPCPPPQPVNIWYEYDYIKDLEMGGDLGLSRWPNISTRLPRKRGRREKQSQEADMRVGTGLRLMQAALRQECLQLSGLELEACTGGGSVGVISPYGSNDVS